MKFYFDLQRRMLARQLSDFGLNPVWGYLLVPVLFVGLSSYLFARTEFAAHIYAFLTVNLLLCLSESSRNDFLKTCFSAKDYRIARLLENTILTSPFIAFLLFKSFFLTALSLLILSSGMAFLTFGNRWSYTIPTPFRKQPFEFVVGFRRTFWAILLAYFMAYMAVVVGNFNLAAFSLMLVFLVCMSYYGTPENTHHVWIFSDNPKRFLWQKTKTALLYSTVLALPVAVCAGAFFPENSKIVLGLQCLGYAYLLAALLAKYAAFPRQASLPEAFLLAVSIVFPPAMLASIPYFYKKSIQKLNQILR